MMISQNHKSTCEQTSLYYYDFLFQKDKSEIPEHILNHIKQCNNCQNQIYRLKKAIKQSEQTEPHVQGKTGTLLANSLKRHFSYINQDTTCALVKPFLPSMLNTSMKISIPTPITAHLDHCPECVRYLKRISDLNLNNANLSRLSQLFAPKTENNNIDCSKANSNIMAFVMMAFQESDEQILKHLCTCSKCSNTIYQYRESIRNELQIENNAKPCFLSSKLSYNDIFDFTFPYGIDINQYKQSKSIQSRISHIRRCPFCLEKIQEFHHIISDINEQPNSNTITKYSMDESKQMANTENSENLYAGFPVHVEVSGAYQEAAVSNSGSTINFTSALKSNILSKNFRKLSKTGIAGLLMAAIILSAMFIYSPKAKALTLAQLYSVIDNINNVHISSFVQGQTESSQEQWVSRPLNIKIIKEYNNLTLWDIKDKSLKTKKLNSDSTNIQMKSQEWASDAESTINKSLGLIPFYSISEVPPGAEWKKVAIDSDSQNIVEETEAYELSYIEYATFGEPEFIKFRYILKADTELPTKVEFYRKLTAESEYSLVTFMTIEYLSDKEFNTIKSSYFP
ncbi:MAG: hypothetical protein JXA96_06320 [Sedimentisphaerales bacterium]|nr:hypothetical protein [Sedimentisphaerales bacterium]